MSESTRTPTQQREQLWSLIKDIKFAMFTARHANGHLHSRPMTTQNKQLDEDKSLWFFMSRRGGPVADLKADPTVNVVYADPGKDSYVSVSGTAQVVDDLAKKRALWSKMNEAWFKGGPADPDLELVRVSITHADYWDANENKLMQLLHMAAAAVTGTTPRDMAEHATVRP